ncbi:Tetraspanin-8 [Striga hermonthica]|uniref:Tetraspanin-8 n=1 Tax=Striga hermonthica TaxID=68872 RepID=A0A9N7NT37_STRHE|nr:Tetraspanin-8 [Striga hermonthica]
MVRCSNNLVGLLNIITLLLSIPIIGGGIWLSRQANTECERFLDRPVIALGVFVLLVSIAGLVGSCCRVSWLLWVYLLVMFLLIVLLFCFTIFAFVVTNRGAGEVISGRGYREYRLGDYSNWLQNRVNDHWGRVRSCLVDSNICQRLLQAGSTPVDDFYREHLSALQSGCCKPSNDCNFTYVSPTNWTSPQTPASANPDCARWSNEPRVLCYECDSCKAGLLDNIKTDWKRVAVINIIFLVFLIIVYSVGCCAFRNNREDNNAWKRYP